MDEDNYKEAIDASFKVFAPRGISKFILAEARVKIFGGLNISIETSLSHPVME